ncbi:MAG: thiol:disulfide interchange protein DsbA/DsbL [Burkholderiales bacterium]
MGIVNTFVFLLSVLMLCVSVQAAPVAGKDYLVISPAQPTDSGNKIEVVEVFSYMCPHCGEFEPKLAAWVKQLPADTQFRRMPVVFGRASWELLARTYFALEAMGDIEKVHAKIFQAIHEENVIMQQKDVLFDWIEKQGIDRKKFAAAFDSFSMGGKIQRSTQRAQSYGINGVPSVVIDGKYLVSTSQAGNYETMMKTVDELLKQLRAGKAATAKPAMKAAQK